jgi:hypothetical protein
MKTQLVEVGTCIHHGTVPSFRITMMAQPEHTTGPCCMICYIEWIKEQVPKLTEPHMIEVQTP